MQGCNSVSGASHGRPALSFLSAPRPQAEGITAMEFRLLGGSGFKVPALSLGTGTFGGKA